MNPGFPLLLAVVVALAGAGWERMEAAERVQIVAFGPATYAPAESSPLGRAARSVAGETRLTFSDQAPLSPSFPYSGPAFFGGALWTNDQRVARAFTRSEVRTGGPGLFGPSAIVWSVATTATTFPVGGKASFSAIIMFPRTSWVSAAAKGTVALQRLECEVVGANPWAGRSELRWVVKDGGRYLISEDVFAWGPPGSTAQRPSATRVASDFAPGSSVRWAILAPEELAFEPKAATWRTYSALVVEAVGIHAHLGSISLYADGGTQWYFGLREFSASAELW